MVYRFHLTTARLFNFVFFFFLHSSPVGLTPSSLLFLSDRLALSRLIHRKIKDRDV